MESDPWVWGMSCLLALLTIGLGNQTWAGKPGDWKASSLLVGLDPDGGGATRALWALCHYAYFHQTTDETANAEGFPFSTGGNGL